ncbi:MAG TPA: metalloregulator ArsR/SmtB family transcription factor [Pyrinomonadaceae bacterium]|nr:metalloregulator ArsR/SmtB family transcription factor [Pyrinomonadaceae bacterium]
MSQIIVDETRSRLALRAKFFRGLGDATRLAILGALRGGAMTVNELAALLGLSQPNVSNHLSCLKNCGHVRGRQSGRNVYYELGSEEITKLLDLADALLAENARGVYECAHMEPQSREATSLTPLRVDKGD